MLVYLMVFFTTQKWIEQQPISLKDLTDRFLRRLTARWTWGSRVWTFRVGSTAETLGFLTVKDGGFNIIPSGVIKHGWLENGP